MRYKPERALTHHQFHVLIAKDEIVEMRYKPERALTRTSVDTPSGAMYGCRNEV